MTSTLSFNLCNFNLTPREGSVLASSCDEPRPDHVVISSHEREEILPDRQEVKWSEIFRLRRRIGVSVNIHLRVRDSKGAEGGPEERLRRPRGRNPCIARPRGRRMRGHALKKIQLFPGKRTDFHLLINIVSLNEKMVGI